jgi:hypothetical protein
MSEERKSLDDLKNEVIGLGFNVQQWAACAGLPWQRVYRKISKPHTLLLTEYYRLLDAADRLRHQVRRK